VELKKYCVNLLEKLGSLSYTRSTLEELDAEVRAEMAKLGGNPLLEDYLDGLLGWKRDTDEKNQSSEELMSPQVLLLLFICDYFLTNVLSLLKWLMRI
jgi:geranylgeranyl diphosphate synthase type 3